MALVQVLAQQADIGTHALQPHSPPRLFSPTTIKLTVPFWFALCVYYLGGVLALTVATTALGMPMVMMIGMGGWSFVGLFFLLWNSKNLDRNSSKWIARIVIVLILLSWAGAATGGS